MMGFGAATGVSRFDGRKVELSNDLNDKLGKMPFRQPVVHGGWKQEQRVAINLARSTWRKVSLMADIPFKMF
jgi:hypothetical protein